MRLIVELALLVFIVLFAVAARAFLMNLEDEAFEAELTAAANERARLVQSLGIQEMNAQSSSLSCS